jgi:CubicO group peptidase (beta-lactamase class C family)
MVDDTILPRSDPEAEGVSSRAIHRFLDMAEQKGLELHDIIILRHGRVIAEGSWHPYENAQPHAVYSVTKSFTSLAVGLLINEGLLSLDDLVISFFPEHMTPEIRDNMKNLQIRHLLTMSTGHLADTCRFSMEYQFMSDRPAIWLGIEPSCNWIGGFFRQPVSKEPGTWYVYNSGASQMLAEIVKIVTGQTLADFLQPRLFDPLGISKPVWEASPAGVSIGGYGLSLKIEDLARVGQLCLQRGLWQGQQLVPDHWIDESSSCQISTADSGLTIPDYLNGYGYQFWRSQSGGYRMDGAFGQYCLIQPEQDAVIALFGLLTGTETQDLLDLVWNELLPAMSDGQMVKDPAGCGKLRSRMASLQLVKPSGEDDDDFRGTRCSLMDPNEDGVRSVQWSWSDDRLEMVWEDGSGRYHLPCGKNSWITSRHPVTGEKTAAMAHGLEKDVFAVETCRLNTPYHDKLLCQVSDGRINMTYQHRGFVPKDRTLSGTASFGAS